MIRLALLRALVARRTGPAQLHRRLLGTHRRRIKPEQLELPNQAREFVYGLSPANRTCLLKELQSFQSQTQGNTARFIIAVFILVYASGSVCTEASVLVFDCVSAAALGNLVSDLAGLGLAGYVEALAARFGMQIPDLTPKQVDMWQTRVTSHMGKAIGVAIGCILGMFPLLFLSDDEEEKEKKKMKNHPTSK
uniref:Transmembrane protein 65 n=1 Tax=Cyprinus carpio TaxID=7962 RepID=A0A8C1XA98_CYPCA